MLLLCAMNSGVDLPISTPASSAQADAPLEKGVPGNTECLSLKRVLVVDDDPVILATASSRLKAAGFEVLTALDPSQAITAVGAHKIDVILLDINFPPDVPHGGMPSWDGLHLMCWLRTLENAADACYIVISGDDVASVQRQRLAGPAVAFFQKPIDYRLLLSTIEKQFGKKP